MFFYNVKPDAEWSLIFIYKINKLSLRNTLHSKLKYA